MLKVSIIAPVYNGSKFLDAAVSNILEQTFKDWELLLFDDGSTDESPQICKRHSAAHPDRIRYLEHRGHANRGQLGTRVAGADAARAEIVALFDQDDVWDVDYLEKHVALWDSMKGDDVQLSYGPGLYWYPESPERDYVQPMPPGTPGVFAPPALLTSFFANQYAATPLPSCTLITRTVLQAARRFAKAARGSHCEDQYLSWFVAARWPIAIHGDVWVHYLQHADSALSKMLATQQRARRAELTFLRVMRRELAETLPEHELLVSGALDERIRDRAADDSPATRLGRALSAARRMRRVVMARARLTVGLAPLSENFGQDRGLPILRYYTERFLEEHVSDIRGSCLEFEGADYTHRYGGTKVSSADVLHLDASNPAATLVADLTKPNDLPSDRFDCILCTFVLHEIFDLEKALSELYRVLKPGAVMLITVPHVSMCEPRYHELWRFTVEGLTQLVTGTFGDNVSIRAYGSSLTGAGQLRGLVADEFTRSELDHHDPRFAVLIGARVTKPVETK